MNIGSENNKRRDILTREGLTTEGGRLTNTNSLLGVDSESDNLTNSNMLLDIQTSLRHSSRSKLMDNKHFKSQDNISISSNDSCFSSGFRDDDLVFRPADRVSDENHNTSLEDDLAATYGTFHCDHYVIDQESCDLLASRLHNHLCSFHKELDLELFIPATLLERVAQEVLREAATEPYGLKGCVIHLNLQRKNICHKLGKVICDPHTVATFELYLTLDERHKCWYGLSDLFTTFVPRCFNEKIVYVSPEYRMSKNKLYRRNSSTSSSLYSIH